MKNLVIIPAYNEEKSLERTIQDITEYAPSFDYVIVNDCSTDDTLSLCTQKGYHVITLPVNLGIGGAVQTGYQYAVRHGYEIAVQFDGDAQHDARYLEPMLAFMQEHKVDLLIGSRFLEKEGFQSSGLRRIGIRYFTGLINMITGVKITDPTSGMRMAGIEVITLFAENYPKDYPEPESSVTILRQGKQIAEYPVIMRERTEGVSSISFRRSIYYMIKVTLAILMETIRRYEI
ncbi:MAG: glycosyltransferase family 2 protein [Lachnospiraceae bacterium]